MSLALQALLRARSRVPRVFFTPSLSLDASARADDEQRALLLALLWLLLNAAQALFLVAWTSLWITLALIVLAVTFRRDVPLAMARRCWGPGVLRGAGVTLEVEGGEDVDWTKPHVFVSNHTSSLDVPAILVE